MKKKKIFKRKHFNLKRTFSLVMSFLMLFTTFSNNIIYGNENGKASYSVHQGGAIPGTGGKVVKGYEEAYWDNIRPLTVENQRVFCIEPLVLGFDSTYSKSSEPNHSEIKQISLYAYYGYDSLDNKTDVDYATTQYYIWEKMGVSISLNDPSFRAKYNEKKAYIDDKIRRHNMKPSFNNQTITVKAGETKEILDLNNVIGDFDPKKDVMFTGFKKQPNMSIYGDKLYIDIPTGENVENNASITLERKIKPGFKSTPITYRAPNRPSSSTRPTGQDVLLAKIYDPGYFTLKFNVQKQGKLKLAKQDEDGNFVPNTKFTISYNSNMSNPIGTYTTGSDGTVTTPDLDLRTVYIQEVEVPEHLVLDKTIKSVTIQPNKTTTFTARNNWKKSTIQVVKKDVDTRKTVVKANTTFSVFNQNDEFIQDIVTDGDGSAEISLRYGDYYLVEKTAPNGYVQSGEKIRYELREDGRTYEAELSNKRVKGNLKLRKEDSVYGNKPQGEATLKGAVYGLFAREDIVDPADGTVIYPQGTKILERTTKEDGSMEEVNDLYLGKYYVQELSASNGYLVNNEKINVDIDYEGQTVEIVSRSIVSKETVKKQAFEIIKTSSDGSSNNNVELIKDVQFTYVLKKYVDQYGNVENAVNAIKTGSTDIKDSEWGVMTTDNKGYAKSKELPFGTYVVAETFTPENYIKVDDFIVNVTEDSREPQEWRVINNAKYESLLAIVKQDAETGKTIALEDTTFKVYDVENQEYVGFWVWNPLPKYMTEFKTDKSGQVFLPNPLKVGKYRLEEIKSPNGYLINNTPIEFEIKQSNATQVAPDGKTPILTLTMKDTSVKGQISVVKEGEVLVGVDQDKKGNYSFNYETKRLNNAIFGIYARENIYSADNQKDLIYHKDQEVDELRTTNDGEAVSKRLPLGKYYIKEKTAPNGMVVNEKEYDVELSYQDQNTSVVQEQISVSNDRQKVLLSIVKKDVDTKLPLANAEFSLFANENIEDYLGNVIVSKGTKLSIVKSDEDGKIVFPLDLPLSTYYALETKTPSGYHTNDERIDFNANYQGQNVDNIQIEKEFLNKTTTVEFSKHDKNTNVQLEGAKFAVYHVINDVVDNEPIDTWVSKKDEKHIIKGLIPNEKYILRELEAPFGYVKSSDVEFVVKDSHSVIGEMQSVKMFDEFSKGQFSILKKGEFLTNIVEPTTSDKISGFFSTLFEYELGNVKGAKFDIYAREDIKHPDGVSNDFFKKDEKIGTITTNEIGIAQFTTPIEKLEKYNIFDVNELPLGKYYAKEVVAGNGFVINPEIINIDLLYNNDKVEVVSAIKNFTNQRQKVDITIQKIDEETKKPLEGAVYLLYNTEDIKTFKNVDGMMVEQGVSLPKDSWIEQVATDKNGIAKFETDLPLSKFAIKEVVPPKGYILSDEIFEFDTTYNPEKQDIETIKINKTFTNKINETKIVKFDVDGITNLHGAKLIVYPKVKGIDFAIDTWVTNGEPKVLKGLESNVVYVLHELEPPKGNVSARDIEFMLKDDGSLYVLKEKPIIDPNFGFDPNGIDNGFNKLPIEYEYKEVEEIQMVDDITKIIISKKDIATAEEIEGAHLQILDENKNVIEEWVSGSDGVDENGKIKPHYIERLPIGKYTLVETIAPIESGYVKTQDIDFEVKDDFEIQQVVMYDDFTKVEISKTDITGEKEIPGAEMQIVDMEGNIIDEWISTNEPHYIEKMPVGEYELIEKNTPYGFAIAESVKFKVEETGEIQKVIMKDEKLIGQIEVIKYNGDRTKKLSGAKFALKAYEDIVDPYGNVVYTKGSLIEEKTTNEEGMILFDNLELGKYELIETQAPQGHQKLEKSIVVELKNKINSKETIVKEIVEVENNLIPTSVMLSFDNNIKYLMLLLSASLCGILLIKKSRKNKLEK